MNQIIHWVFYVSSLSGPFNQGFNGDIIINKVDSTIIAYYHNPTYSTNKIREFKITYTKVMSDRTIYVCWNPKASQGSLVISVFDDYVILYNPLLSFTNKFGKEVNETVTYFINQDAISRLSGDKIQELGRQSITALRW